MQEPDNQSKKTLVLGASNNPERYSYKAVQKIREKKIYVTAVGNRAGFIGDVPIHREPVSIEGVDTITLYLNAEKQVMYYEYILSLTPRRLLFNPGTENPELEQIAKQHGIHTLKACTLVLLSIGRY